MDKDRIAGKTKKVIGGIKKQVGKAVGDKKIEARGRAQQSVGEVQDILGSLKDSARAAVKK